MAKLSFYPNVTLNESSSWTTKNSVWTNGESDTGESTLINVAAKASVKYKNSNGSIAIDYVKIEFSGWINGAVSSPVMKHGYNTSKPGSLTVDGGTCTTKKWFDSGGNEVDRNKNVNLINDRTKPTLIYKMSGWSSLKNSINIKTIEFKDQTKVISWWAENITVSSANIGAKTYDILLNIKLNFADTKEYTITFTDHGGSQTRTGKMDEEISAPSPTREGQQYKGQESYSTEEIGSKTLTQKFENGQPDVTNKITNYQQKKKWTQYVFSGWQGIGKVGTAVKIQGDRTYTANYKDTPKDEPSGEPWYEPEKYFTLASPTIGEGYQFLGWFNQNNKVGDSESKLPYDIGYNTVYGKWNCKVKFDYGDGSTAEDVLVNKGSNLGSSISSLPRKNRDGYEFVAWYTAKDYKTQVNLNTTINSPTTFYAKWYENVTIEYLPNGNPNSSAFTLLKQTKSVGDGNNITFKDGLNNGSNISGYRGGNDNGTYTTWNLDGWEYMPNNSESVIVNYSFDNWNTKPDGSGRWVRRNGSYTYTDSEFISSFSNDIVNHKLSLYAMWFPSITVKFPDMKDKCGHLFNGWKDDENTTYKVGEQTIKFINRLKVWHKIFTPNYTLINNKIIQKYFINTTKTDPEIITKTYTIKDNDITLNTPAASFSDDYKFIGWSRGDDKGTAPSEWDKSNKGIYSRDSDAPKDSRLPVIIKPSEMLEENDWGVYGRDASGKLTPYKYGNRNGIGPTWYYYGSWVVSGKYIKVGGDWKRITNTFVKIGRDWKEVTDIYFKNDTWKKEIGK